MNNFFNDLLIKRILLCFLLTVCFATGSFAQLAKMQFEDAEIAYNEGKYAEAINFLDQAERSNDGVNPPIMHLCILARVELIKQNPNKDFEIIDKTRKEVDLFLKQNDGNTELEDKYREVYQASKILKSLPLTREAFGEALIKKKKAATEAERVRKEKLRFFHLYNYVSGFKKGSTLDEYRELYKIKKAGVFTIPNGDKQIYIYSKPSNAYIFFRNEQAYGYSTSNIFDDDREHQAGKRFLSERIAYFSNLFGFEPEAEEQKYVKATTTGTKFKWKNGNTVFYMEIMFYSPSDNEHNFSVDYFNFDKQD